MKITLALCLSLLWMSCGEIVNRELYEKTDHFVNQLTTQYESYGILGGSQHKVETSDGKYHIMPVGRLINVKILEVVDDITSRNFAMIWHIITAMITESTGFTLLPPAL